MLCGPRLSGSRCPSQRCDEPGRAGEGGSQGPRLGATAGRRAPPTECPRKPASPFCSARGAPFPCSPGTCLVQLLCHKDELVRPPLASRRLPSVPGVHALPPGLLGPRCWRLGSSGNPTRAGVAREKALGPPLFPDRAVPSVKVRFPGDACFPGDAVRSSHLRPRLTSPLFPPPPFLSSSS